MREAGKARDEACDKGQDEGLGARAHAGGGAAFVLGALLVCAGLSAAAAELRVGLYCPDPRDKQEGVWLALESASDIDETRVVTELTPAGLDGLAVLVIPQGGGAMRKALADADGVLRDWVARGHGVMTLHDAVGYRKHPVLFPEIAKGVGNPYNHETGYGKFCVVTAEHPGVGAFKAPMALEHGYFDQVVLECGPQGVVLAREGVVLDGDTFAAGQPVVVAGTVGKGRYVANGLATGYDAAGKQSVPKGDEQTLFIGLVRWLAGQGGHPAKELGQGVTAVRPRADEPAGQTVDIDARIEEIRKSGLAPWQGKWQASALPAAPPVVVSDFKAPIELPLEAVKPSAYRDVAEGWTRIVLRDEWRCRELPGSEMNPVDDEGTREGYFRPELDDAAWESQPVPKESWRERGKFTGVVWYRRHVAMPEVAPGRRVVLTFARCGLTAKVWVNGRAVGEHVGGTTPFEFDVTDFVKGGQDNLVAVRVYDIMGPDGKFVTPEGQEWSKNPYYLSVGHLWGEVFLTVKPELHAVRALITPHLATGEIEVDAWLDNPGEEREVSLSLHVRPEPPPLASGAGKPSELPAQVLRVGAGVQEQSFRVPMVDPVLWTPENPYLYVMEIRNGADVLARERFGFRDFQVDGPDFRLNGKRVKLIANIVSVATFALSRRIEIDDEGLFMTRYLLAVKSLNANTIYTMATPHPRQFYDRCDELGLLVYADWNAAHGRFLNVPMVEGWNKGERETLVWMAERYNHPSAVVTALGAELFERYTPKPWTRYNELLNPAYEALKAMDKQGRPVSPSSGRGTWRDPDALTDLHDYHFYPGNIGGSWTDQAGGIRHVWLYGLAHKPVMPVIQYEMDGGRPWNEDLKSMKALLLAERENGRIDRARVIEMFQQKAYRAGIPWLSSLYGFRRFMDDIGIHDGWRHGAGWQTYTRKNVGQQSRILGPLQAGYCPNTETFSVIEVTEDGDLPDAPRGWLHQRLGKGWTITDDLSKKRLVQAEGYRTWQRVNNRRFICLDRYDRNLFAGDTLEADLYVINDIDAPSAPWTARCVLRAADGDVLDDRAADIGVMPGFKRSIVPYSYAIPGELPTGFYRIELSLIAGGVVVSDNVEDFFVLGKADRRTQLKPGSDRKVALYDSRDQRYKFGQSTRDVLAELELAHDEIKDFAGIEQYGVLIVGADSLDETLREAADELSEWMAKGGRLLQFEQHQGGSVPYWRKLKLLSAKPHILAEIIEANHPVFRDMDYRHMECWSRLPDSRTPGEVYRLLLGPIDESVLASGAVGVPRESTQNNQMAIAEVEIGAGRLVMSQMEATQRYGKDAAATRLIWNLLTYVTGKEMWPAP